MKCYFSFFKLDMTSRPFFFIAWLSIIQLEASHDMYLYYMWRIHSNISKWPIVILPSILAARSSLTLMIIGQLEWDRMWIPFPSHVALPHPSVNSSFTVSMWNLSESPITESYTSNYFAQNKRVLHINSCGLLLYSGQQFDT